MDFSSSPRVYSITEVVREFLTKEVHPLEQSFLQNGFVAVLPELEKRRARARETGLWTAFIPEEFGGAGLSLTGFAIMSEELGRSPLGHYVFNCQAPDVGNIELLEMFGNKEQKETYLHPLVAGDIRSCFSMTEVELAGSNPLMMDTTAVKDGDDYVINGQKWYTTSADGAEFAIVMAKTNPEAHPYMQASMIIVPCDTPGFNLVRNIPVMGHSGDGYFSHAEILYQNCRVPQKNLIGEEGQGFVLAQERLGPGRIHHCMRWIGICNRAFDLMCNRAKERVISPDGRTLATKQIIQSWIAECAAEIQAARLMVLHAAWRIHNEGAKAARKDISLIKFKVANVMQMVIDNALQVHGGLGMTDDTILSFFFRHERAARIYDGADEVHKVSVAKQILKSY